jgi:hypothetical protein
VGIGTPLLESDQFIQCLQDNWFINIRDFLNQINAKICIRGLWQPTLARVDNRFVMELVDQLNLPKRIVTVVNNWRIYFQVLSLADITNAAGDRLLSSIFDKNKINEWKSTSTLKWPHQKRPPLNTFCIWKRIIKRITGSDVVGNLRSQKLGDWFPTYYKHRRIHTMIHNNHSRLAKYCSITESWHHYSILDTRYSSLVFAKTSRDWVPELHFDQYIPVDVTEDSDHYYVYRRTLQRVQVPVSTNATVCMDTFSSYLQTNRDWMSPFFRQYRSYQYLSNGLGDNDRVVFCSDGGVRQSIAGFGVVFSLNDSVVASTMMQISPGYNDSTSYRSEAMGMLGALAMYEKLQEFTLKKCGATAKLSLDILSDNEALVKTINQLRCRSSNPKFFYSPDADIINEIMILVRTVSNRGETVCVKHVRGHQDRRGGNLSHEARLNIEADSLATESMRLRTATPVDLPNRQATLLIDGKPVTSHHTAQIREAFQLLELRQHYNIQNSWEDSTFDKIWWEVHGAALSCFRPGQQTTLKKFLQNRLPCNRRENMYYGYVSPLCVSCGDLEHQPHILKCMGCVHRPVLRQQYLRNLSYFLENSRLGTEATQMIVSSVNAYFNGYDAPDLDELIPGASDLLRRACHDQEEIGWDQWVKGRLARSWGAVYEHDLARIDHGLRHPTPDRWLKKIIKMTFEFVLLCWTSRNEIEHGTDQDSIKKRRNWLQRFCGRKKKSVFFQIDTWKKLPEMICRICP